jgi:hypothetical protein
MVNNIALSRFGHLSFAVAKPFMILIPSALDPHSGETREAREGWPLLTEETEVNGDSKSTNERGPSLVG